MLNKRTNLKLISTLLAVLIAIGMLPTFMLSGMKTAYAAAANNSTPSTEDGKIYVTVEILTLGDGFLYEPTKLSFSAGENYAAVLERFLGAGNFTFTGSAETALYISGVKLPRNINVAIPQFIADACYSLDDLSSNSAGFFLSEFDISSTSGWMYTTNNVMAPLGTSDWYPADGDVCRLQFSVYGLGLDLGVESSWVGSEPLFIGADKSELISQVAEVNSASNKTSLLADSDIANAYQIANTILVDLVASQSAVDYATVALELARASFTNEPEPDASVYVPVALDYVPTDWENDLWLQYDFRELTVGQTARIYPRRLEQGVSNYLTNDVERPNFNFEIVQGDSIALTLEKLGIRNNAAVVSALKPGLTIVKVSYDEFRHSVNNKLFRAVSEVNVAYVAFSVTDGSVSTIQIDFNDTLTSYDTLYFSGESLNYNIAPIVSGAVSVELSCNGLPVVANTASYTLPLKNMQNIIGIKATDAVGNTRYAYKMIDARKIEKTITNRTEPGTPLKAGQVGVVSFKGITLPVYKLASIYNPILGSSAFVQYNSVLGTFQGKSGQWDLATHNSFEVGFAYAGTFAFTGGKISESWYDPFYLGYDKVFEGQGSANVNDSAITTKWFSQLPDFSITVEESTDVGQDCIDEDGYFVIYNPSGMLLARIEALLISEFGQYAGIIPVANNTSPRGFDYSVVKKLRIIGPMTNDDFFGDFGMRRYSAVPTDIPASRMGSLQELDLSQAMLPGNTIPNFSLMGFSSCKTLRLPINVVINSFNVFNGDALLDTIVIGDKPFTPGVLDFSGSQMTSPTVSPSSNGLKNATKLIFPDVPTFNLPNQALTNLGGGASLLEEIVFLGNDTYITIADGALRNLPNLKSVTFYQQYAPTISVGSNSFATNNGSGSTAAFGAVAYVRTPDANGYELDTFRSYISGSTVKSRFVNVLKLDAPDLLIMSAPELAAFATEVNAGTNFNGLTVELGADIDLSAYSNWTPIANSSANAFRGTFDGKGYVIKNLTITGSSNYRGLFGYTGVNATIKNLGIASGNISGGSFTGAIVGSSAGGSVSNCFNAANLSVGGYSGGIVGSCRANTLTVSSCYNIGNISIRSSYDGRVGGIIGDVLDITAIVENCYNTGSISGGSEAGGIVGWIRGNAIVRNCYNSGNITSSTARGVVGLASSGTVNNCFYLNSSAPSGGAAGVQAITATELSAPEFVETIGQAFVASPSWFNSGYPVLSWQILPAGPSVGLPGSGDPFGSGYATMDVALMVAQIVVGGGVSLTPEQLAAVDMDFDGVLTMADIILIIRKASGL